MLNVVECEPQIVRHACGQISAVYINDVDDCFDIRLISVSAWTHAWPNMMYGLRNRQPNVRSICTICACGSSMHLRAIEYYSSTLKLCKFNDTFYPYIQSPYIFFYIAIHMRLAQTSKCVSASGLIGRLVLFRHFSEHSCSLCPVKEIYFSAHDKVLFVQIQYHHFQTLTSYDSRPPHSHTHSHTHT